MNPASPALRRIVERYPHRPAVYWFDLLASAACAWGSIALASLGSVPHAPSVALVAVAGIAQLRAVYFVHEIVHLRRGVLPGFARAWFVVAGLPSLITRFMVEPHLYHHQPSTYGTLQDPEYAPVPAFSRLRLAAEVLVLVLAPPALVLRFAVLGPLSWTVRPLRRIVLARLSALATQPGYVRPAPSPRALRRIVREEIACGLFVWGVTLAVTAGLLSLRFVFVWWASAAIALTVNMVRTFVAHAYAGPPSPATIDGQVRDTLTLHGDWSTELTAPLGTRYHAIHHLAPGLPYHALAKAHADLREDAELRGPLDDGAREGLTDALSRLWRQAKESSARSRSAGPDPRIP